MSDEVNLSPDVIPQCPPNQNGDEFFPSSGFFGLWRTHNIRRFEPWYSTRADYNTNAKSYYDYIARNGYGEWVIQEVLNRLLARKIAVTDTNTIDLTLTGSWQADKCGKYDDEVNLKGDVILSTQSESVSYPNINKGNSISVGNAITKKSDGLYAKDLTPVISQLSSDIGDIINDIKNITNILNKIPKDMVTTVTKEIWNSIAHAGDTFTLSESLSNFDGVRVKFNVGGSQYSTDLTANYFLPDTEYSPTFGGIDNSGDNIFQGFSSLKATDSTLKSLRVVTNNCRLVQTTMPTGSITQYYTGLDCKNKTGECIITGIHGISYVKYT